MRYFVGLDTICGSSSEPSGFFASGYGASLSPTNEIFHLRIYAASHNRFLVKQATALRNRMANSFNEHQAILEAIIAGHSDLAATLLRAHIVIQGERFADLVATLQDFNAAGVRSA